MSDILTLVFFTQHNALKILQVVSVICSSLLLSGVRGLSVPSLLVHSPLMGVWVVSGLGLLEVESCCEHSCADGSV